MKTKKTDQIQSKPRNKRKWIVIAVLVIVIAAAAGGNAGTSQPQSSPSPQPNTSTMVDALARQARQDIQENGVSDQKCEEAMTFIVETYPDFYADNEMMEQAMAYGFWLEYAYEDDAAARIVAELGMDVEQAVKYVYRGAETVEDQATQENLNQIRKSLEALGILVE